MNKIYVAGPYTHDNPNHNTRRAILVADELLSLGFTPFVPHLTHLWDTVSPHAYETWLNYDMQWLEVCDALLACLGTSDGVLKEIKRAEELGIPVFYGVQELCGVPA